MTLQTKVRIENTDGKMIYNLLIDDGTNVLPFESGYGFVAREVIERNHWRIIRREA